MAVDLYERKVALGIGTDNLCVEGGARIRNDLDLYCVVNYVAIGNDVAIWADEEARSLTPGELAVPLLTRRHSLAVGTTEFLEKLIEWLKWVCIVTFCSLLRSCFGFHADGHNGWPDRGYEVGEPGQGYLRSRYASR